MARKTAPTRQRPQEVRSWHVHGIPNSHIYVQINFCLQQSLTKRETTIFVLSNFAVAHSADQHLTQHTRAQFPIDRSEIRLNSKLFAQTVVRRAVIMWRDLVKWVNPSYIFQEDEDRTTCNRHVRQPSLAQHALDANTWAGGGSLGYLAHA